ncbi:MAG: glycosyltransferase [Opitutales bacterium]|nr:glycosyltransferase [Opitutales bacterium]
MTIKPSITVITPCYNSAATIDRALESVETSSTDSNRVEHLIIDAHSSDRTVSLVQERQNSSKSIQLLSEPDNGQSEAMNKGLRLARGSVVGFLNADDYYEPGALEYALKAFEKLPEPSLLIGNCRIVDDKGREMGINRPRKLRFADLMSGATPPYNPCAYFYHRSLHEHIGYYDEEDHYSMDLDFILKAVRVANVHYVDKIFGTFVWHGKSKTAVAQAEGLLEKRVAEVRRRHLAQCSFLLRLNIGLRDRTRFLASRMKRCRRIH